MILIGLVLGSPSVCSRASSCLAALAVCSGLPDHLMEAVDALICTQRNEPQVVETVVSGYIPTFFQNDVFYSFLIMEQIFFIFYISRFSCSVRTSMVQMF